MDEKIIHDSRYTSVYTDQNEEEHKELINKIDEVHNEINEKVKAFNKYTSPEGHYKEANHIMELIDNYNELVATKLSLYDTNNDDINQIMKNNSNEFNIKDNENLENHNINSNDEILKKFVDTSKNNKLLLEMKDSFKLGYKLMLNELSNYRDQFMMDEINGVTQHKKIRKLNSNSNSNNFDDVIITINRDYNDISINVENQLANICINQMNELVRYSGNTPSLTSHKKIKFLFLNILYYFILYYN
ncbi:hypothetical protein U3516DRAFT_795701 [Neocallimastix sp. 'constans']